MREKDFSIYNSSYKVRIDGGHLWKVPPREESGGVVALDDENKTLSIYLHPDDKFLTIQDALFDRIKERNWLYFFVLQIKKRVPSLLLLIPITLTVSFIGLITVWGDLVINWVFLGENAMTVFGLPMNESAIIYTVISILIIYFFPVLFTGEQEGFIEALNERFSNREELRKRFRTLIDFLKYQKHVTSVEIWNPDIANEEHDWVGKSLVPALMDVGVEIVLHIRNDERQLIENYFQKKSDASLNWEELPMVQDEDLECTPIAYEYLETWEKSLLAVYVFASTASLPKRWQMEGQESDGVLNNVLSLRLVKILVERFKERLFSEEDLAKLISLDLFASRCLNDYGILVPSLRYSSDIWKIHEDVVVQEKEAVEEEMKFMISFLQTEIEELVRVLDDPVAAIKLNSTQEYESIYNEHRLMAIRFFIQVIYDTQQFKILKKYWSLIITNLTENKDMNADVYRIIGVDLLLNLTVTFERAAMYENAGEALDYIERVYPFRGKVGKARIMERRGDYEASIISMSEILDAWNKGEIQLKEGSLVDLNLDISWAVVCGRLEQYREKGWKCIDDARKLLYGKYDTIRNSDQTIRMYNILANYEDWEGNFEGAIANYNKALQIPGARQAGLSNLLVNKGISLRAIKQFKEGAFFGEQGVIIKTAIGDADQLPIALHNLAQTCIELAFSLPDKTERLKHFEDARKHAQVGLDIQAQTGSVKKRGQLLAERFIGHYELAKVGHNDADIEDSKAYLKEVKDWLRVENEAGRGNMYDCRVVFGELFGCLEEFSGTTLESVLVWTMPKKM